jgi:hypothetical protein
MFVFATGLLVRLEFPKVKGGCELVDLWCSTAH